MIKKNSKQQNKKPASKQETPSRPVLISLSTISKSSLRGLQNAIRRHKTIQQTLSHYDNSIPEDYRFRGILASQNIPKVSTNVSVQLSPYILELRQNNQMILDDEIVQQPILLNFLCPYTTSEQSINEQTDTSHDLELSIEDIRKQLYHTEPYSTLTLPSLTSLFSNLSTKQSNENIPFLLNRFSEKISLDTFIPITIPENILSYFDFPETEETESSEESEELVEFSDLSIVQTIKEKPCREPIFSRTFSFLQSSILLPQGWQRAIGAFVLVSFAFVLPLHAMNILNGLRDAKSTAQTNGTEALNRLKDAANVGLVKDPASAGSDFEQASLQFAHARESIDGLGTGVKLILSSLNQTKKTYKSNRSLLKIGEELSIAGSRMAEGLSSLKDQINPTPASRIAMLQMYLKSSQPHLIAAQNELKNIDTSEFSGTYKETFSQINSTLPILTSSNQQFLDLYQTISEIIGSNGSKHYLLVFQNNTEMRATGGFMGSFAEVTVHDGLIEKFIVPGGGTYDLQGWLKENLVSPWPLQLVSARWEFQDANWFPDFPTSARQILQFYKSSGGSDVDGVIAVNATFIKNLIGLLGPVEMSEFGRTIDQNNFIEETQKIVETEYDKTENKPKEFIGSLAPKLLEKTKTLSPEQFLSFAESLNTGLSEKDIQIYFTQNDLQKTILANGWGGEIKPSDKDYLMVVNTNIGGGKTDGVISDAIDMDISIEPNGDIIDKLTITRTHTGISNTEFSGVNNVNFLRVYVPKGSVLLKANGFSIPRSTLFETPDPEWIVDKDLQYSNDSYLIDPISKTQTYEENGKTVFGNWMQTKPGNTSTVTFEYKLPIGMQKLIKPVGFLERASTLFGNTKTDFYSLTIQKQSGVQKRDTTVRVHIPDSIKKLWNSDDLSHSTFNNTSDHFFGALFEQVL